MNRCPLMARTVWVLALCFAFTSIAEALPKRRFVSGDGNDSGPCSRKAPCRTIGAAINAVEPGGVVIILDSASYRPVTINKAVTVEAARGMSPGINVKTGVGITIDAGPSDVIVLRGLSIYGFGGDDGIEALTARVLHVENCVSTGFARNGLGFRLFGGHLFVKDSIFRDNVFGIHVNGMGARASIDRVRIENTEEGLSVWQGIVSVRDSVVSGNTTGIQGGSADGEAEVSVENCLVANNQDGIRSVPLGGQVSLVRVANSTITSNQTGLVQSGAGTLLSRGDNTLEGNTTDTSGTIGSFSPQ